MKILIADDHVFTLQGTKFFVENLGYEVVDTCMNGISAQNSLNLHFPDIAILDINMPGLDGLDVAQHIFNKKLNTKVILMTMHKEASLYRKAQEFNVYGYVLKEQAQSELENCLKSVAKGEKYVSANLLKELKIDEYASNFEETSELNLTEKKIIELIKEGHTTKQIAELLFLSHKTIEGYRSRIIEKLKIPKEKNALLLWVLKNG